MKINSLMVNDWVAEAILPSNKWQFRVEDFVNLDDNDSIPIELSEDILKKNGFEHIIGYECYYSTPLLRQSGIVLTITSEMVVTNWTDHNENVFVEFSCAFVHELQHALRLCGLRELADNFKVN